MEQDSPDGIRVEDAVERPPGAVGILAPRTRAADRGFVVELAARSGKESER